MRSPREGAVLGGKYAVERPLAQGGMASIWVGRHLSLDLPVAIKFMNPELSATPDGRLRFEREARAIAMLQGPNVVRILDYGLHDDQPYMVMDLLRGEDLGRRLRTRRLLPLAEAATVVAHVGRALKRAHEAGIIHRDLKPANVFFAGDGDEEQVTVLDFGVAKMSSSPEEEVTRVDAVIGSVHYMSPEQARARKDIDPRSDLWSLGVLAFRMITGQLPFHGEATTDVLVAVCTEIPRRATTLVPTLPAEIDAFFARALAKDPADRFQTADELVAAFGALVSLPPQSLALPETVRPPPPSLTASTLTGAARISIEPGPTARPGRSWLTVAACCAALVLAVLAFLVRRVPAPAEPTALAAATASPAERPATSDPPAGPEEPPHPPAPDPPPASPAPSAPEPSASISSVPAKVAAPAPVRKAAKKSRRLGLGF